MACQNLPSELINRIQRLSVGVFRDQPADYMKLRTIVCGLSSVWRAAGIADSLLWSHVYITSQSVPEDIMRWIGRSNGRPLDFHIMIVGSDTTPDFLDWFHDSLGPHLSLCQSFTFICPRLTPTMAMMNCLSTMDGSSIRSIHLDIHPNPLVFQILDQAVPYLFQNSIPLLTTFSLRRNFLLWNASSFYGSLQEIRFHSLGSVYKPSIEDFLNVFRATPLLMRLFLKDIVYLGGRITSLPLPTLSRLTHLDVVLTQDVIDIVGYLTLPALYTVRMQVDHTGDDSHVPYMNVAWYRILDRVTTAVLRVNSWNPNFLPGLLRRMVHLRRLDLRPSGPSMARDFNHVIVVTSTSSGFLRETRVAVLGSILPKKNIEAMLQSSVATASDLHLIIPQSQNDNGTLEGADGILVEHFLHEGNVVSKLFYDSIDYWLDDCIIP
jgi:hypothetical protein